MSLAMMEPHQHHTEGRPATTGPSHSLAGHHHNSGLNINRSPSSPSTSSRYDADAMHHAQTLVAMYQQQGSDTSTGHISRGAVPNGTSASATATASSKDSYGLMAGPPVHHHYRIQPQNQYHTKQVAAPVYSTSSAASSTSPSNIAASSHDGMRGRTQIGRLTTTKDTSDEADLLTIEEMSAAFDLPLADAARQLEVCETGLKKLCRRKGITRWPYRKLKCLRRVSDELEIHYETAQREGDIARAEQIGSHLQQIHQRRQMIMEDPRVDVPPTMHINEMRKTLSLGSLRKKALQYGHNYMGSRNTVPWLDRPSSDASGASVSSGPDQLQSASASMMKRQLGSSGAGDHPDKPGAFLKRRKMEVLDRAYPEFNNEYSSAFFPYHVRQHYGLSGDVRRRSVANVEGMVGQRGQHDDTYARPPLVPFVGEARTTSFQIARPNNDELPYPPGPIASRAATHLLPHDSHFHSQMDPYGGVQEYQRRFSVGAFPPLEDAKQFPKTLNQRDDSARTATASIPSPLGSLSSSASRADHHCADPSQTADHDQMSSQPSSPTTKIVLPPIHLPIEERSAGSPQKRSSSRNTAVEPSTCV